MSENQKRKIRVGIIGCGTIGSYLARAVQKEFARFAEVACLCDHHRRNAESLKANLVKGPSILSLKDLVRQSDLILEAASQGAVTELLKELRTQKRKPACTVLIMSVGGLLKASRDLTVFLKHFKGQLLIPSGAVAGIDGLLAAKEPGIRKVRLVTRKPPKGLQEAPYFRKRSFPALKGSEEIRVFRGRARQAILAFPQNINVAALLSLAGLGQDKTTVEIWTSKAYRYNRHEIEIEYKGGALRIQAENKPSAENPKTSALAMYSAVAALRKFFSSVKTGT